jgi:hypothetical protein
MTLRFLLSAVAVSVLLAACQSQPSSKPYSEAEEIAELKAQVESEPSVKILATQNKNWQEVYPDVWVLEKGGEDGLPYREIRIENSLSGMAWALENIDQKDAQLAEKLIAQSSDDNVRQRLQSRLGFLRSTIMDTQITLQKIDSMNQSNNRKLSRIVDCAKAKTTASYTSAARGAKAYANVSGCAAGSVYATSTGNFLGIPSGGQINSASGYNVGVSASVTASSGSCSASSSASNQEGDRASSSTGCGQQ